MSRKPNLAPALASIVQIVSSKKSNDEISIELAEIIGFDDIELVSEILADRQAFIQSAHRLTPALGDGSAPYEVHSSGSQIPSKMLGE
jgi:antiviral helicase SLH1